MTRGFLPGLTIAFGVLALGLIVAFTVGRYPVSLGELADVLISRIAGRPSGAPPAVENVVLLVRGPRVVAALLVGAALAVAGTAFQGLFRNPLVSPDILGASSGAALGAVLGIFFSLGVIGIESLAFTGGLIAVAAVYVIGTALQSRDPILVLVLTGVVVGALLGAGVGLVKYLADPYNQLPAMTFWLLGSLAATTASDIHPADFDHAYDLARRISRTNNAKDHFEYQTQFWNGLFSKAQRPILQEVFRQLNDRMARYEPLYLKIFPTAESRPRQWEVLIQSYRKGKTAEAFRAFRKVYLEVVDRLIDHLRREETGDSAG